MAKKINTQGAFNISIALLEFIVTRCHVSATMKIEDIAEIFDTRRNFVNNSPYFVAIVDVLEYDVDKFRAKTIERLNVFENDMMNYLSVVKCAKLANVQPPRINSHIDFKIDRILPKSQE